MRVLVAYHTQTGNTEKIARAIHAEARAQGYRADLQSVRAVAPKVLNDSYDLVFLGSPCHNSDLARAVKKLLAKLPPSPAFKLAGFVTHATYLPEGGERQRQVHNQWAGKCLTSFERTCREKAIPWAGYFGCQGVPSRLIEAFIHRAIVKEPAEWVEYVTEVRKHPTESDLEGARTFAKDVLAQCG